MENEERVYLNFGKLLREMYRILKKRINEQDESDQKLTIEQFMLLHAISKHEDDVIQKDMAEMMGKDKSAILRLIDCLEKQDLIRRVVDKNDRRKNYLMLTKSGEKIEKQYDLIGHKMMMDIESGIQEEDLQIFRKVMFQLLVNAKKL